MSSARAIKILFVAFLLGIGWFGYAVSSNDEFLSFPIKNDDLSLPSDTGDVDLPLPHGEDSNNPTENTGGISLDWPDNIDYSVEYDPVTGEYVVVQTIGDSLVFRYPTTYGIEEYVNDNLNQTLSDYWNELQEEESAADRAFAPKLKVGGETFDRIFGSNEIEIRPQGNAELTIGFNTSKTDNPRIPERQRRITTFDFNEKIQLNVVGNIGTKLQLTTQYNTEATFDFENQMKLEYTGEEDEIIKKIEAGNVSLPLKGTLITGSSSLFGLKVETQFGRLRNTTVFSQQKGERKEIQVEGGAQTQTFDIRADNYEANRHYFLSEWFGEQYDLALQSLPVVNSGVNITRIEVWVVNTQANTQDVRNIIGMTDLGENEVYMSSNVNAAGYANPDPTLITNNPSNSNNVIFQNATTNPGIMSYTDAVAQIQQEFPDFTQGVHFERVGNARRLNTSEYTYNSRLGFISLRQSLNNAEVLAVSYEYTLNGETYKVGTLSQDGYTAPDALILKMLKSSITQVKLDNGDPAPLWDLMMKNVYSIGAFGVNKDDFRLNVWYNDPNTGVDFNYIPRDPINGKLLIQVLNMDQMDINSMPNPDGFFDFVDNAATMGGLINSQNGRIYFPVREPFGTHLANEIIEVGGTGPEIDALINTVVYQPLYDSTKTAAQQIPSLNRFRIKGEYKSSSSSEISLNALNVPQGSVSVTAGGVRLIENQDYTVDYNLGRVKILNEGLLDSGTPINISLESNSLFNIQTKTLIGSRFDYEVSDNFNIGATILNLRERPITQKVNIGDEPVNNTILGMDLDYQTESPFITRMVDRLPFIETKAVSNIDISAEGAYLIPGHSRAIGKDGNAYVDDFEGSQSTIDIRSINQWFLASTPKLQTSLFPEGNEEHDLVYNYNRAKLSWYIIDTQFFRGAGLTDGVVSDAVKSDHRSREVLETEVFPNRDLPPGTPPNVQTLDMSFYPSERGPYNYDQAPGDTGPFSEGVNPDGSLIAPETRWGGIQRALTTTDFEASNIEFIQFWLMDPFNDDSENLSGGDLYFNLGNVSEDILNDSQLSYENGYSSENTVLDGDTSLWGVYPSPSLFNVVNAFDNSTNDYSAQDIGIDGLNSSDEADFFADWLNSLNGYLDTDAFAEYSSDPSADDFTYFRNPTAQSEDWDILRRYKDFNGYEGNSNTNPNNPYVITATTIPNTEDINGDITLGSIESYFQYRVSLRPNDLGITNVGNNYITDAFETTRPVADGSDRQIKWYQFKIPVKEFENSYGSISDFRSIRFIRMFMKGFSEPVTLRFARLELVRGEWRKYVETLAQSQEIEPDDPDPTIFNTSAVNIEENGNRSPVNYVTPPGIIREVDPTAANQRQLNEQSLELEVCNLKDGDARAAYRNVNFDMRMYKKLKMFAHAEAGSEFENLNDDDVSVFVRLGSDFDNNYYEYEIPLKVTPWFNNDADDIWPLDNDIEIEFQQLQSLKLSRPNGWPISQEYTDMSGKARIKVKGNPNLANVVTVMVGIRNPSVLDNPFSSDDGMAKCAIVWVNELRLTDFNEQGGWAAVARANANLADFGNMSVAVNASNPGWGTLEQRVQERQREQIRGVDANSTLQLGKFFPESFGVQLPMYLGYSETVTTPQFNPLAPDIELTEFELSPTQKRNSQSIVKRRSVNFSNVRISPTGAGKDKDKEKDKGKGKKEEEKGGKGKGSKGKKDKTPFYSISNFTLSYGYSEIFERDINTEFQLNKSYTGGLNYNFSNKPTQVKPFANIGVIKTSPLLKWLKDFNFYTGIKSFSFGTAMDRTYETSKIRNNTEALFGFETDVFIQTQVLKTWNWSRDYTLKYDLTKNLKFDYNANNLALVGEPAGLVNREDQDYYEAYKDTVLTNIQNFGETTNFNQAVSLSYKLPFDKLPLLDFINSDVRYQGTYRWDRAPFSQDSLGNTIQNSRNLTFNGQANFVNLYNKVDYLKELNSNKKKDKKGKKEEEEKDPFGNVIEKEDKNSKLQINPLDVTLRFLMMVRNVSGSYTRNEGILLPGYNQETNIIGMDDQFLAPGLPFVFGHQNTDLLGDRTGDFATEAAANGWLAQSPFQNQQYNETFSTNWNVRANLEPFKYFKIELTANSTTSENIQSFFRYDDLSDSFNYESTQKVGNYSASIFTWPTAFVKDDEDFNSETFEEFLLNRLTISERLNSSALGYNIEDAEDNGYYEGWGPTSQSVTIPAFIAAYTGQSAADVSLDPFKAKVRPNWRVTYDGLTKIPAFKKKFKQFNVSHSYRSTTTTSFVTNLDYAAASEFDSRPSTFDQSDFGNLIVERQINNVAISEQMSPLIGFDMTLKTAGKNDPQIKVEVKRDRNVAFGLSNFQITETKSNSFVFGIGYRFTEVPNPFIRTRGKLPIQMLKETDLALRADLTIRDNVTIIRRMEERQNQATAGQKLISIKTSADLEISKKITVRFFYDHQITKPKISTSFPTSNISSGLSVRFTLAQ